MSELKELLNQSSLNTDLSIYRLGITFEVGNVPIETLCLPKTINTILKKNNFLRVRDLIGIELHSIDGIGRNRAEIISRKIRTFFSYDI